MTDKGRNPNSNEKFTDTVADKSTLQAVLMKQDAIIDLLTSLMAKLDADTGVTDTDYASTLTDDFEKVKLR